MEEYVVIVLALMSAFAILLLHAKENFNKPLYPIELGTKDDEAFHQLQKIAPKSFMGSSDWFITQRHNREETRNYLKRVKRYQQKYVHLDK